MNSDAHSQINSLMNGNQNPLAAYAASLESRKRKFYNDSDPCDFLRPDSADEDSKRSKLTPTGEQGMNDSISGIESHISCNGTQSSKSLSSSHIDKFCSSAQDLSIGSKLRTDNGSDMDDISEMDDNDDELDIEKCAKPFEDVSDEDDDERHARKEEQNKEPQDLKSALDNGVDHFFKAAQFSPILDVNGDDSMRFLQDSNPLVN